MVVINFYGTCSSSKIASLSEKKGKKFSYRKAIRMIKAWDCVYTDCNCNNCIQYFIKGKSTPVYRIHCTGFDSYKTLTNAHNDQRLPTNDMVKRRIEFHVKLIEFLKTEIPDYASEGYINEKVKNLILN